MKTRRRGGLTEYLPTPAERREGLIRDHVLDLVVNVERRLRRLEEAFYISDGDAQAFRRIIGRIREEEGRARTPPEAAPAASPAPIGPEPAGPGAGS